MVRSAGLSEERMLSTGTAVFASLHGFVSLEAAGYFSDLGPTGTRFDLDEVFELVIRGAVTAAVLEATH